jgi:hypothetical protein
MGLKGYRLWVMGQLDSTCRAPPRGDEVIQQSLRQPGLPSLPGGVRLVTWTIIPAIVL